LDFFSAPAPEVQAAPPAVDPAVASLDPSNLLAAFGAPPPKAQQAVAAESAPVGGGARPAPMEAVEDDDDDGDTAFI
jgi:hypothetical protein